MSDEGVPCALGIIPEIFTTREACAKAFAQGWPHKSKALTAENCWVSDITPTGSCFCVMTALNPSTPSKRISFADLAS